MSLFQSLADHLRMRLAGPLPGPEAQYRMAPAERLSKESYLSASPSYRESAVMALLYPADGEPMLVLTERQEYKGAHSGQVSLPGGRVEPQDADTQQTALRETEEEIGVVASQIIVVGQLTDLYIPPSRFMVYPYVGVADQQPVFRPDPVEVKTLLEVPLRYLSQPHVRKHTRMKLFNNLVVNTPYFDVQGRVVWGATAMIISELLAVVEG